jgi:hypothetical protein
LRADAHKLFTTAPLPLVASFPVMSAKFMFDAHGGERPPGANGFAHVRVHCEEREVLP